MASKFSRRQLIKGLGLSATALGLPTILSSSQNVARADEECPLRFVIFYEKHGYAQRMVRPRAPGETVDWAGGGSPVPGEALGSWVLPPAWQPLEGYEDRLINLVGMDMRSAHLPSATADGGGHGHLATNALTSAPRVSHNTPGGPSIDQYIADGLVANGIVRPVHSIGVNVSQGRNGSPMYRPDGTNVPSLIQPPIVYDTLFPEELQASAEERERLARRRTATGNLVQSLGSSLTARLPRTQRERVEAHLQLHRDLQARLGVRTAGDIPDRASTLGVWAEPLRWVNDPSIASIGLDRLGVWQMTQEVNVGLVAAALHADITRVAVIGSDWLPDAAWDFEGGDADAGIEGTFGVLNNHGFQHEVENEPNLGPLGDEYMLRYHQTTMSTLRYLMDTLAALPEDNGTSVLDNTIILHATEMADPGHRWQQLNWQVIGDGQGQFRTGRTMVLPRVRDEGEAGAMELSGAEWGALPVSTARYHTRGPRHGQLFVTLANAMGVETETFGDPSICPGPIDLT